MIIFGIQNTLILQKEVLTRLQKKYIKALKLKKFRDTEHSFVVEGEKNVISILKSKQQVHQLICTSLFLNKYSHLVDNNTPPPYIVEKRVLQSLGNYKSNEMALAVVRKPEKNSIIFDNNTHTIVLEDIRDPGNLGTIIRIADWYGIKQIILSPNCTDIWNPKVISASMGSILNVTLISQPIIPLLENSPHQKWATTMKGEDIHKVSFSSQLPIMIFFGNESKGISPQLLKKVPNHISIQGKNIIDSLNVSIATGIVCDNMFRQLGK